MARHAPQVHASVSCDACAAAVRNKRKTFASTDKFPCCINGLSCLVSPQCPPIIWQPLVLCMGDLHGATFMGSGHAAGLTRCCTQWLGSTLLYDY